MVGDVVTMDPTNLRASAFAVSGGRFVAVGDEASVREVVGPSAPACAQAGCIVPGFIDSHNHMLATGLQRISVDLSACRSIDDVLSAVADYASRHPDKPWLVGGQGWHIDALKERRYPTRQELDSVCRDRPVYLPRIYHAAATNTMALELGGILSMKDDPAGGHIVRDGSGAPTGELHEAPAFMPVQSLVPALTIEERKAALLDVQNAYLAAGICGVIEPGLSPGDMGIYEALAAAGELKVRTVMMPLAQTADGKDQVLARLEAWGVRTGFGNERLKLGGVKVFLDGGASLGTALLREPYPDDRCNCGIQVTDTETLRAVVDFCARNRWSIGVHTVGGRAIDIALQAFEEASRQHDIRSLRFSLIHAYLWPSAENIALAARLGVGVATQASMQFKFASNLMRRFGRSPIAVATPIRSWLEGGVVVAGGSDAPATPFEPLLGIWQAATRMADEVEDPLGPEQRISAHQAMELYTRSAAWLSFSEHERGRIAPGLLADWVVLRKDPLTCPAEHIKDVPIDLVAIGGETVHIRGD